MRKLGILCMMLCASLFVQAQELSVGAPMPSFKLNSTVYGKVNSADLKGKVVLISMFATWCGPCQLELAEVEKTLWPKYKDNKDFVLVGVDREETKEEVETYIQKLGTTYPMVLDTAANAFSSYALRQSGITRNVLIDRDGKIVKLTRRFEETEFKELVPTIDSLLSK